MVDIQVASHLRSRRLFLLLLAATIVIVLLMMHPWFLDSWFLRRSRPTYGAWGAPVVWDDTVDYDKAKRQFPKKSITVGLITVATGKYFAYVHDFLKTAEEHFMPTQKVTYFVFTDGSKKVPELPLKKNRAVSVISLKENLSKGAPMTKMEMINKLVLRKNKDLNYVFCMNVDSKFVGKFGVEAVDDLVGTLHPGFYWKNRFSFPYETNAESKAYVAPTEGEMYFTEGLFGGNRDSMLTLTETCAKNRAEDEKNGVKAAWHEEGYLNRYFVDHAPTRILSPEYCFPEDYWYMPWVKYKRVVAGLKDLSGGPDTLYSNTTMAKTTNK
ncbi:GBGT1 [Branchiostoma lanceolatum]|uniref:GBGT1 protein n=1 Tax=Branchiostoma lanceolatum TaxID=7740 RepID=A0A8J9YTD5_BRALA|nr:GBGT1 [Branchiostoma lanceolatum]